MDKGFVCATCEVGVASFYASEVHRGPLGNAVLNFEGYECGPKWSGIEP